jgi:predicted metalloendopeptidase
LRNQAIAQACAFVREDPSLGKRYVELAGAPAPDHYLVTSPQFFKGLEQLLQEHPLEHWKAYLRWQMLHLSSPQLGKAFVDENFDF